MSRSNRSTGWIRAADRPLPSKSESPKPTLTLTSSDFLDHQSAAARTATSKAFRSPLSVCNSGSPPSPNADPSQILHPRTRRDHDHVQHPLSSLTTTTTPVRSSRPRKSHLGNKQTSISAFFSPLGRNNDVSLASKSVSENQDDAACKENLAPSDHLSRRAEKRKWLPQGDSAAVHLQGDGSPDRRQGLIKVLITPCPNRSPLARLNPDLGSQRESNSSPGLGLGKLLGPAPSSSFIPIAKQTRTLSNADGADPAQSFRGEDYPDNTPFLHESLSQSQDFAWQVKAAPLLPEYQRLAGMKEEDIMALQRERMSKQLKTAHARMMGAAPRLRNASGEKPRPTKVPSPEPMAASGLQYVPARILRAQNQAQSVVSPCDLDPRDKVSVSVGKEGKRQRIKSKPSISAQRQSISPSLTPKELLRSPTTKRRVYALETQNTSLREVGENRVETTENWDKSMAKSSSPLTELSSESDLPPCSESLERRQRDLPSGRYVQAQPERDSSFESSRSFGSSHTSFAYGHDETYRESMGDEPLDTPARITRWRQAAIEATRNISRAQNEGMADRKGHLLEDGESQETEVFCWEEESDAVTNDDDDALGHSHSPPCLDETQPLAWKSDPGGSIASDRSEEPNTPRGESFVKEPRPYETPSREDLLRAIPRTSTEDHCSDSIVRPERSGLRAQDHVPSSQSQPPFASSTLPPTSTRARGLQHATETSHPITLASESRIHNFESVSKALQQSQAEEHRRQLRELSGKDGEAQASLLDFGFDKPVIKRRSKPGRQERESYLARDSRRHDLRLDADRKYELSDDDHFSSESDFDCRSPSALTPRLLDSNDMPLMGAEEEEAVSQSASRITQSSETLSPSAEQRWWAEITAKTARELHSTDLRGSNIDDDNETQPLEFADDSLADQVDHPLAFPLSPRGQGAKLTNSSSPSALANSSQESKVWIPGISMAGADSVVKSFLAGEF
ncbi:hypothetical protein IE53DRAFT_60439 [Violaceomyces palustris]|uniref:Uncharacterized protein n=1 Tax=Violaceomyces palustris TaxID=1673888 RepID=A0ACD0NZG9_9BASI|nr:hypothetical protein IE53DRAFT_60439 [Violaceomyces palustris]